MTHNAETLSSEFYTFRRIPPENLYLRDLDRPVAAFDGDYRLMRLPGPIAVAAEALEQKGSVAIADIGCGTANMVATFAHALQQQTGCEPNQVYGVGVSRYDYSPYSRNPETRRAVAAKEVGYVIGKGEALGFPDGLFDVVFSCEAIQYTKQPDVWLSEMRRVTAVGGYIFPITKIYPRFGIGHDPAVRVLKSWKDAGDNVTFRPTYRDTQIKNVYYRVQKRSGNL